jgi:hypothetical protein
VVIPSGCPATSEAITTLHCIISLKEHGSHLHHSRSLKSYIGGKLLKNKLVRLQNENHDNLKIGI